MTNTELVKWLQRYPESMEVKIRVELVDNENGKVLINNCPIGLIYEYDGEDCIVIEGWKE